MSKSKLSTLTGFDVINIAIVCVCCVCCVVCVVLCVLCCVCVLCVCVVCVCVFHCLVMVIYDIDINAFLWRGIVFF